MEEKLLDKGKRNTFIEVAVLVLFVIAINAIYLRIRYFMNVDEFPSIASALWLGGRDWSSVTSLSHYHGYGHLLIMSLFTKLFSDGVVFYRFCMILMIVYRIVLSVLSYFIFTGTFQIKGKYALLAIMLLSVSKCAPDSSAPNSAMTELPLCLISLAICIFIKRFNYSTKAVYAILIGLLSAFAVLIHSRALIIQFSVMMVVLYMIISSERKVWIKAVICLIISFAICYIAFKQLDKGVIKALFSSENVKVSYSKIVSKKLSGSAILLYISKERLPEEIKLFFSLMASWVFYSYGTITFFIGTLVAFILKKRKKEEMGLRYCIVFSLSCWVVMNGSIALQSIGSITSGNLRWYTYVRYSNPFTWLIVIFALIVLIKYNFWNKKIALISLIVNAVLCKWFINNIATVLDESNYGMNYTAFNTFWLKEPKAVAYFTTLFALILAVSILILFTNKRSLLAVSISVLSFISLWFYIQTYEYNIDKDNISYYSIDKSVDYISSASGAGNIYVTGSTKYCIYLQFGAFDRNLIYAEEIDTDELSENDIVLSDVSWKDRPDYVSEVILDENEYLYMIKDKPELIKKDEY